MTLRRRAILIIGSIALITVLTMGIFWYVHQSKALIGGMEAELRAAVLWAQSVVDPDSHINAQAKYRENPGAYLSMRRELEVIREKFGLSYIYTLVPHSSSHAIFVLDTDPDWHLGESYETYEEIQMAFSGRYEVIHTPLVEDEFGVWKTALAPLRDASGRVVGVIGVDLAARDLQTTLWEAFRTAILITILVWVLVSWLGAWLLARQVTTPLHSITQLAHQVAEGDLRARSLGLARRDEVGDLGRSVESMVHSLQTMVASLSQKGEDLSREGEDLARSISEVATAATQVAAAVEQMAQGAGEQSQTIGKMAQSVVDLRQQITGISQGSITQSKAAGEAAELMEAISQRITQTAKNAQETADSVSLILEQAQLGKGTLRQSTDGMREIQRAVQETAEKVQGLEAYSNQIGEIIQVISEIANRSNLLSLNAAIEAARAGEHGKGFAVVADEVGSLARRSAASAQEIGKLIRAMQDQIREASTSMQKGTETVAQGRGLVEKTDTVLGEILNDVHGANPQIQEISRAAVENAQSAQELTQRLVEMGGITQANEVATQHMASQIQKVSHGIENMASLSEETAAATEEASASMQETSRFIHGISQSAGALAKMAKELQRAVTGFQV